MQTRKKVMTYTIVKKTKFTYSREKYLNVIKQGYKDCDIKKKYLILALREFKWVNLEII